MRTNTVFEAFNGGRLVTSEAGKDFSGLPWNPHPTFPGVSLKHLLAGADTGGGFSYHLVRIEPGKAIGDHFHDPQLETHEVIDGGGVCVCGGKPLPYSAGAIAGLPARVRHEVAAGEEGLLLFAKFMPPLC